MGLPPRTSYSYHRHDGQILIQPGEDGGYLYLMTGGHGGEEDPFLGKILRFNIDSVNGKLMLMPWTMSGRIPCICM